MLQDLKHLQANGPLSEHTLLVESQIHGFLGDVEALITGLSILLDRSETNKPRLRRLLARARFRRAEESGAILSRRDGQEILELMKNNVQDDPGNDRDIRIWFRVYRQQRDFSLNHAIERMAVWADTGGSADAFYYLYILHYMRVRQGVLGSLDSARKYLAMCKAKAPILINKKSFEWWAADTIQRPCPLVHHGELGEWNESTNFFSNTEKLGYLSGTISKIDSGQSGIIMVDGMPAFFAPRGDFIRSVDLNRPVKSYVGFSYEGLRAWNVRKA